PAAARDALATAIVENDRGALAAIARAWNTAFSVDQLARDSSLWVTNGPYVISDIAEGESVTLRANSNYRGARQPTYETVIVRTVSEPGTEAAELANGA